MRPHVTVRRSRRIQNLIESSLVVGFTCILGLLMTVGLAWPDRSPDLLGVGARDAGIGALTVVAQTAGTMLALFGAALLFGLETYRQSYGSRYWNALSTSLNLSSLVAFHLLCLIASFAAFGSLSSDSVGQPILLADLALVLLAISVTEVIAAAHKIMVEPRRLAYLDDVLLMNEIDCAKRDGKVASAAAGTRETSRLPVPYLGEAAQLAVIRRDDYAVSQVLERSWAKLANLYDKDPQCVQMTGKQESPLWTDCEAFAFVMERALLESKRLKDISMHETVLREIPPVLDFASSHSLSMEDVWGVIREWHGIVDTALAEGWDVVLGRACPMASSIVFNEPKGWSIPTDVIVNWLDEWSVRAASTGNAALLYPFLLCAGSVIRSARKPHHPVQSNRANFVVQTVYETLRKVVGEALDSRMAMADVFRYDSPLSTLFLPESAYSPSDEDYTLAGILLDITRDVLKRGVFPPELRSTIERGARLILSRLRSDPPQPVGWKANSLIIALHDVCTGATNRETWKSDRDWAIGVLRQIHEAAVRAGEKEVAELSWNLLSSAGALSKEEIIEEPETRIFGGESHSQEKPKSKRKKTPKPGMS